MGTNPGGGRTSWVPETGNFGKKIFPFAAGPQRISICARNSACVPGSGITRSGNLHDSTGYNAYKTTL